MLQRDERQAKAVCWLHVVESKLQNLIWKTLFKLIENKSAFHSIDENLKVGKHNTWKQLKLTEEDKGDQQEAELQHSFVLLFVEV